MRSALLSLFAGGAFGVMFALLRLPVPAPPTIAGVLGVVGVTLGYLIVKRYS